MKTFPFSRFLHVIYTVAGTVFVLMLLIGLPYYTLPISERPHSNLHGYLKPGGLWGHGAGVIGSAMILLLFLYSARKRQLPGFRWGPLNRWLDVHIFFGIVGPLLITLHTAMKFHGFVSISYFSMVAVAISGVFGRYIYMQIPRDAGGLVLGMTQALERDKQLAEKLEADLGIPEDVIERVANLSPYSGVDAQSGLKAIALSLVNDLILPHRTRRLRRYMEMRRKEIPEDVMTQVLAIAREKSILQRRLAFLNEMNRTFHYWHVIHKPFAYVMVIIMFVHVIVTVSFGYTWIF